MGIDIEWKMVQGAPYKKWEEMFKGDPQIEDQFDGDFNWFLYEGIGLVSVSPWYDADPEDCVFGIELASGCSARAIDLTSLDKKANEIYFELLNKYNIETETLVSQNVW